MMSKVGNEWGNEHAFSNRGSSAFRRDSFKESTQNSKPRRFYKMLSFKHFLSTYFPSFFFNIKKKKIIDEVTSCNLLEDNCKSRIVILQFYFFKILSSEIIQLTDTLD